MKRFCQVLPLFLLLSTSVVFGQDLREVAGDMMRPIVDEIKKEVQARLGRIDVGSKVDVIIEQTREAIRADLIKQGITDPKKQQRIIDLTIQKKKDFIVSIVIRDCARAGNIIMDELDAFERRCEERIAQEVLAQSKMEIDAAISSEGQYQGRDVFKEETLIMFRAQLDYVNEKLKKDGDINELIKAPARQVANSPWWKRLGNRILGTSDEMEKYARAVKERLKNDKKVLEELIAKTEANTLTREESQGLISNLIDNTGMISWYLQNYLRVGGDHISAEKRVVIEFAMTESNQTLEDLLLRRRNGEPYKLADLLKELRELDGKRSTPPVPITPPPLTPTPSTPTRPFDDMTLEELKRYRDYVERIPVARRSMQMKKDLEAVKQRITDVEHITVPAGRSKLDEMGSDELRGLRDYLGRKQNQSDAERGLINTIEERLKLFPNN